MWTICGVILLACGVIAQGQDNLCNQLENGTGIVPVGVPGCRHFYQCNNWVPYLRQCAGGTYFNPTDITCDSTICVEGRNLQQLDCVPGVQPGTDCREYVTCVNNQKVFTWCGNGTMYSNFFSVCVHEDHQLEIEQQCILNN